MHCDLLRDYRGMREQAEKLIALSRESGFAYLSGNGPIWLGRVMVAEGKIDSGIQTMLEGRRALMVLGELAVYDISDYYAAIAYLDAARAGEGLAIVNEAIAKVAAGGSGAIEADLYRLKGELRLMAGKPGSEAEESFHTAIAIAQRQQARSWELRATTSLARLMRESGRRDEARRMLAEIYNWFSEGFDTRDLQEAKQLLNELDQEF
jgi:predicted ATPase